MPAKPIAYWFNSLSSTPMADVSPAEAGFDGAKGIRMNLPDTKDGGRFYLKRGKTNPSDCPTGDFREQLVWHYPDDATARLLWCNAEDQWFELAFTPIDKP